MLVLVDLFEFEVIVAPELGVTSSHGVGGFQQIIAEIAVAGLNHLGMLRFKVTGLVSAPDKTGKLGHRCLGIETADVTNFSDDTGGVDLANAWNGSQGVRNDLELLLNGFVQHLDLLFQGPHRGNEDGHGLVHGIVHRFRQTEPLAAARTALAVASGSANLPRPVSATKAVNSSRSAFASSSTVSNCSMSAMVVALVF